MRHVLRVAVMLLELLALRRHLVLGRLDLFAHPVEGRHEQADFVPSRRADPAAVVARGEIVRRTAELEQRAGHVIADDDREHQPDEDDRDADAEHLLERAILSRSCGGDRHLHPYEPRCRRDA